MKNRKYVIEYIESVTGHIILNRPEVHNAFNIEMIREIYDAIENFNENQNIRIIVISARGENFSAGADLKWMKEGLNQDSDELVSESRELAMLFNQVFNSPKITVCLVKGKVLGGANGIIAASDFSIASRDAGFAFSEVKIGLLPATIAPYVVRKTGLQTAYEWMITGRWIPAEEAAGKGLVTSVQTKKHLDTKLNELINTLKKNSPAAIQGLKKLFHQRMLEDHPDDLVDHTSKLIAEFRKSEEAQEGIRAFFEKRIPAWIHE